MILAILNLHGAFMPLTKFQLNWHMNQEEMCFEEFKDGCHCHHLRYQNGTISSSKLSLHVVMMTTTKF